LKPRDLRPFGRFVVSLGFGFWDLGFGIFYLAVRFMNQFGVFSTAAEPIVWNPNRS